MIDLGYVLKKMEGSKNSGFYLELSLVLSRYKSAFHRNKIRLFANDAKTITFNIELSQIEKTLLTSLIFK